ncbi:MAG: thioredoxin family protein [Candidatus Hinthialibacter antarcticus]|nr:thioredoxin family protein [Candidatus Hinthialibacter antarcticus]
MNAPAACSQRICIYLLTVIFCAQVCIAEEAAAKPSFYDESGNAQELIDQACARAQRDGKRVLLQYGGNWCTWCVYLHHLYESDPEINKTLHSEYEIVYVDVRSNRGIEKQFGAEIQGVPFLTVIEPDGSVVTHQSTVPLEKGRGHDPKLVLAFLNQWKPAPRDAVEEYERAQETAHKANNPLWTYYVDAPTFESNHLDDFVADKSAVAILEKHFVILKIDEIRMQNVDALKQKLKITSQQRPWNRIQNGETILMFQFLPHNRYENAVQRNWKSINAALQKYSPQMSEAELVTLRDVFFKKSIKE